MSTYTITALGVSLLLVLGIRMGTWGLLRFVLLVHLVGDLIFAPLWLIMPTYAAMRYIADDDRMSAALFLALVVVLTDVAYRCIGGVLKLARRRNDVPGTNGRESIETEERTPAPPKSFAGSFLAVGLVFKLIFLASAGVLTGARSLSDLRPDDSVGFGAIVFLADFLIPFGLAALRKTRKSPGVGFDLVFLAAVSYFSFSKAAFITYVAVYGLGYVLAFGHREARRQFISWRLAVVVLVAFLTLGIKTQQRSGLAVSLSSSVLADQATVGSSARFMGGIFRTYTVTYREIAAGWPPLGGAYHEQALALAVPHFLWPEKPRVASEQLYYLLGITEEAYGTAFAANVYGAMLFDFGILGTIAGALMFGVLLRFGDEAIPTWRQLKTAPRRSTAWHFMSTAWLYMAIPLSEGGIPVVLVSLGLLGATYLIIENGSRVLYRLVKDTRLGPSIEYPVQTGAGAT